MVAAVHEAASTTTNLQDPKTTTSRDDLVTRPPLLPSEKDNKKSRILNNPKKPKSKTVSSRYMSPSPSTSFSASSTRFASPSVSKNSNSTPSSSPKRSVSVDRRRSSIIRPLTPDLFSKDGNATDMSAATKLLITSTRSLSVSFQGESFSLAVSKTKLTPSSPNLSSARKGTPERRRTVTPIRGKSEGLGDQSENPKSSDHHRWPSRYRTVNPLSRSLNCSGTVVEKSELIGSINGIRRLKQSVINERRISLDLSNSEVLKMVHRGRDGNSVNNEALVPNSDITTSDSDSVSSGSTSGVQGCGGAHVMNGTARGIAASARFWQETNSRLRRLQDPGSLLSTSPGSKLIVPPKSKRCTGNSSLLSSPRTTSSPILGNIKYASPSKIMMPVGSSPSRGNSPSRIRNVVSTISNNFSFPVDVQRGRLGENKVIDAHLLRLLYNRHLQWRFVNARSEGVLLVQHRGVKKHLWNAWITISDLRDSVTKKRHRLQLLRQKLKLATILEGQMTFLENWASLDKDHLISLVGAIEALTASTLRLPVVGAIGDVQSLHDAIGSAFDIMQTMMASSLYLLLPMAEKVSSLSSELAKLTAKEQALLEQCMHVISSLAAMQVKDTSLRTHIIQHTRL